MSDIVERLRKWSVWGYGVEASADMKEAADEIERLRAEVVTWQGHAKTAIWSDSEECKLLTADNERLRAALRKIVKHCHKNGMQNWPIAIDARAALEENGE